MTRRTGSTLGLAGLLMLGSGCSSGAEVIGRAGSGAVWQVAADGSRLYAGDQSTITIYDVSEPAKPRELARLEAPGYFGAMAASGSTLFVEAGIQFKGLETAPDSLDQEWIRRGWLKLDERSYSQGVFVGVSQLMAFDLADPAHPVLLGALNVTPPDTLASRIHRMFLAGTTLYALPELNGAFIVDVADPRRPMLLGALGRGMDVVLKDRHLYVADGPGLTIHSNEGREDRPGGFAIVDASKPAALRELGRLDAQVLGDREFGANVSTVAVAGHHAYLGLSILKGLKVEEYLVAVDVADPAKPREVGRLRLKKGIQDLAVVGRTLYARAEGSILKFDLSAPATPKEVDRVNLGEILSARFADPTIVAGTWKGIHLLRFASAGRKG